jgi:hypothetical protein
MWFARCTDEHHINDHLDRLRHSRRWREKVLPTLSARWARTPQRLRLAPTERSTLR